MWGPRINRQIARLQIDKQPAKKMDYRNNWLRGRSERCGVPDHRTPPPGDQHRRAASRSAGCTSASCYRDQQSSQIDRQMDGQVDIQIIRPPCAPSGPTGCTFTACYRGQQSSQIDRQQCFGSGSGRIRIIGQDPDPDPDPYQETLIWIRVPKKKS